jgi:predicted amidohydrolase
MGRVAVMQLVTSTHVQENLKALEPLFAQAAEQGAALVVLPENFSYMGRQDATRIHTAEVEGDGPIQTAVSQLAKRFGLWVVAGTIPLIGQKHRNRASSLVYDAQGKQVACYDKIHLFDVQVPDGETHQESLAIQPGHTVTVVDTPVGCIGLSVCYDLRFPELYRQLVLKGAQLFTVPSAFTAITGAAHWASLLRARAIENLCYVLAPNQGGLHENGRQTHGHSMIVDPWGEVLTEMGTGPGLLVAETNLSYLQTLRQRFPCNDHHIMA